MVDKTFLSSIDAVICSRLMQTCTLVQLERLDGKWRLYMELAGYTFTGKFLDLPTALTMGAAMLDAWEPFFQTTVTAPVRTMPLSATKAVSF